MPHESNGRAAKLEVLAFGSPRCPDCRKQSRALETIRRKFTVTVIDIYEKKLEAEQYRVTVSPTYVVLVDGTECYRTNNVLDLL